MLNLEHYHGIQLPHDLQQALEKTGMLLPVSPVRQQKSICKADEFYLDGSPKDIQPGHIYPVYAAWYLGYPVPATYLDVTQKYRETASEAAVQWLMKVLPYENIIYNMSHVDGIHVRELPVSIPAGSPEYTWSFPDTALVYTDASGGPIKRIPLPVLPWPDSRENDDDWEGCTTPAYAEVEARLLLWCWHRAYDLGLFANDPPERICIVRITGNTPGDLTIRTIRADEKKDQAIAARIYRAYDKAVVNGIDPLANLNRRQQLTWLEKRQEDEASAYRIEDPDFQDLLRQYMETTSLRKTLEEQKKAIESEMESIAVSLASLIQPGTLTGTLSDGDTSYTVSHSPKRTSPASVSADLVQQYYPEFLDLISVSEYQKERVTVEVL